MNIQNAGRKFLMATIGGRLRYQKLFRTLFFISCHGMNFGELSNFKNNGENLVLEHIKKTRKNPLIFDVGANQGEYSSFILNTFNNKVRLYSFEPSKVAFRQLKKIKNSNIFNIGFSDKKKKAILFSELKGSTLASLYQRNLKEFGIEMDFKEKIDLNTIDNFCSEHKIKRIHFLKIDVEGNELKVLKGEKNGLCWFN